MGPITKARLTLRLVRTVLTWSKRDIDYRPAGLENAKFMSARQAVSKVPDGAVVMSSGMGANMRPAILYFAFRDVHAETAHPQGITWISASGQGGRGRVPGTVEEVAQPGLCCRFISGHLETAHAMLQGGAEGRIELHTMPQGQLILAAEAQGRGEPSIVSDVGVGTFVDPRVGPGSPVSPNAASNLISIEGEHLRYTLPPITCAAVLATEADADGNIYMRSATIYTEVREAVLAAKRNGGFTIVTVAEIIPKAEKDIFLRAEDVDAIVVCPRNEQTLTVPQREHWAMFLPGAAEDLEQSLAKLQFVNRLLKLDPLRGPVENAMARAAVAVLARLARPGAHLINGYGLPQEVGRVLGEAGLARDIDGLIETGVHGGVPAPGLFFGTAINPERLVSSAEMFRYCRDHLDATVLGLLQVDAEGNVNVSRKSARVEDYVGPGGFIDLVCSAKSIVFVGAFQHHAKLVIENGRVRVLSPGKPKFVAHVDEVTFSGQEALRRGQAVYYVTSVATFRLTSRGLELIEVMPGIDVQRDILDGSQARIHAPESVAVIPESYITGVGYRLAWAVERP